ncbi:MAG: substrate-binding domain-containing protein, partial [Planctomycetota bacterium]|nr:substrate-binding domain-containing protein [Planctomycetota bacterium]
GLFYGRMLRGMQDGCGDRAQLALKRIPDPAAPLLEQITSAQSAQGLIVVSITAQETLRALAACGLPVVFFDCATPEVPGAYDIVVHANEAGGYQAATALIELGHRRIGMLVHGSSNDPATAAIGEIARDRRAGFERALRERGLEPNPAWVRPSIPHSSSAYALTRELLRAPAHETPTALVCTIDEMAAAALAAAKDAGLRVPEDISVAGMGDVGVFSAPALASVRMQVERSGEDAVRMLLERIARPDLAHRKHVLSTEFIARGSIGMPRAE